MDEKKKPFGKFHDVWMVILGFFLTGVLGSVLGSYFQRESWDNQNQETIKKFEKETASKIFEELSSILDRRRYSMIRLYSSVNDTESSKVVEDWWNKYDNIVIEYNQTLNKQVALISRYFGDNTLMYYYGHGSGSDTSINKKFRGIHSHLKKLKKSYSRTGNIDTVEIKSIKQNVDILGVQILNFNKQVIKLIQDEKIGVFMEKK